MKLGFIILNYNGDNITMNCVDSLLKYYPECTICIVDNKSEKKPIDAICEKYKNVENITILKSDNNYGYAVGNNIGINYLRQKGIDYIAVVNNDTIFQNDNLLQKISEINDKNIGVISLQLSNLDGTMQNPYGAINKPIKTYWKIGLMHMLMIVKVWDILKWIKRKFKKPKSELQHINYENFDYVISGAAFILTPNFFEHYDQLFNKTFLYCEENILAMYLKKAKLKSVFLTNSQIIHLESQSADFTSYKKLLKCHESWWKGLRVVFKSSKGIKKHYSNHNYKYEVIKE